MRAICLYIARTCASKASHWSGPTPFLDAARCSGGTPFNYIDGGSTSHEQNMGWKSVGINSKRYFWIGFQYRHFGCVWHSTEDKFSTVPVEADPERPRGDGHHHLRYLKVCCGPCAWRWPKPDSRTEMIKSQLKITTANQFPAFGEELPANQQRKDLFMALGVVVFDGQQGHGFYQGGHDGQTANTVGWRRASVASFCSLTPLVVGPVRFKVDTLTTGTGMER
jgi:hypothetical protein